MLASLARKIKTQKKSKISAKTATAHAIDKRAILCAHCGKMATNRRKIATNRRKSRQMITGKIKGT